MDKARFSAGILFVVTMLFWFSQYAYTSYVNPELERMGVAASFMGFVSGAYGFTQLVLRIPVGITADKWQKKFFICAGCLCAGLASLCMLVFYNPAAFLAGRALGGVAASAWVPYTVLYSSYFKPEHAIKSITMLNAANQIGRMLSFLMAGIFVAHFGPKFAFLLSAIVGFLGFGLGLFVYEDKSARKRTPLSFRQLIAVAGDRNLLVTTILAVFVQIIAFATYFSFTANHAYSIGATPAQLSYMNVVLFIPSIILSFLLSKYILHRIPPGRLIFIGFALAAFYCGVLPFVSTIPALYAMQAVAGGANTLTLSILMGLCVRDIPPENRGAAMGFFQAIYGFGMTIGPIIMGFMTDLHSLRAGFFFMAAVAFSSAIATIILIREKKEEDDSLAP